MKRFILLFVLMHLTRVDAHTISEQVSLVKRIKQSTVGVGVYNPLHAPKYQLRGTGFAVTSPNPNRTYIVTNHHVINGTEFEKAKSEISVHVGEGNQASYFHAKLLAQSERTDTAILELKTRIPGLNLAPSKDIYEAGTEVLISGLPISSVLGLYKSVHKGMVAAYVPKAIPQQRAGNLTPEIIQSLRNPMFVYQLDATAYPGNSGSPIVDVSSGNTIAILNSVLVKKTKEHVLSDPSGISYAIPIKEVHTLINSIK